MTVVSMRCEECGEVKRKEKIEVGVNLICKDCKNEDVPQTNSDDNGSSEVTEADSDEKQDGSVNTPIREVESTENSEEDKKTLEETFSEQDPLDW